MDKSTCATFLRHGVYNARNLHQSFVLTVFRFVLFLGNAPSFQQPFCLSHSVYIYNISKCYSAIPNVINDVLWPLLCLRVMRTLTLNESKNVNLS